MRLVELSSDPASQRSAYAFAGPWLSFSRHGRRQIGVYVVDWADEKSAAAVGSERETLDAFLDFHRETLLQKCADLSPDQLAARFR